MTAWLFVPLGIVLILLACFGVHCLIGLSSVSFPASVACMILLFFALIGCEILVGDRRTRAVVQIVDISVSDLDSDLLNIRCSYRLGWFCSTLYKHLLHAILRPAAPESSSGWG